MDKIRSIFNFLCNFTPILFISALICSSVYGVHKYSYKLCVFHGFVLILCNAVLSLWVYVANASARNLKLVRLYGHICLLTALLPIGLLNTDICLNGNLHDRFKLKLTDENVFVCNMFYGIPLTAAIGAYILIRDNAVRRPRTIMNVAMIINLFYLVHFAVIYRNIYMVLLIPLYAVHYFLLNDVETLDIESVTDLTVFVRRQNIKTIMLILMNILTADTIEMFSKTLKL